MLRGVVRPEPPLFCPEGAGETARQGSGGNHTLVRREDTAHLWGRGGAPSPHSWSTRTLEPNPRASSPSRQRSWHSRLCPPVTDLAIGLPTALRLAHTSSAAAARSCRGAGHSPAPALDGRTDGRGGRCARGVPGGGRSAVWLSPKKACSVPVSTAGGFSSWSLYQRQTRRSRRAHMAPLRRGLETPGLHGA